jgi:hypothetical protein
MQKDVQNTVQWEPYFSRTGMIEIIKTILLK